MLQRICEVVLSILVGTILSVTCATAQRPVPEFKDYPASEPHRGKRAPSILTREDIRFRTRLKEAAKMKPNFARHYILTAWGCGAECLMGAVIDAKTGKVHWIPFTICCWGADVDQSFKPIDYRLDSSLVVFSGARNEKAADNGKHYYKFEKNHFVLIRSIMKKEQG